MSRPFHHIKSARAAMVLATVAIALTTWGCGSVGSGGSQQPTGSQTQAPSPTKLIATVTTSGQVTLTTSDGRNIARLHSGWYTVFVTVNASRADFHLTGPGVDSATKASVPGVALWGIHFLKGTYRYMNDRDARAASRVLSVY